MAIEVQNRLNQRLIDRDETRLAARVSVWRTSLDGGSQSSSAGSILLHVQNRSPVPISWVLVSVAFGRPVENRRTEIAGGFVEIKIADVVPPCAIATVVLPEKFPVGIRVGSPEDRELLIGREIRYDHPGLVFWQGDDLWRITEFGVPSNPIEEWVNESFDRPPIVEDIGKLDIQFKDAADCGEGG